MTEYGVVLITTSSLPEAETISENLVTNKLAACVTILPNIKSFYWWDSKLCKDDELMLIAKIKKSNFKELEKAVKKLHSYDIPEIIMIPLETGSGDYLNWIERVSR